MLCAKQSALIWNMIVAYSVISENTSPDDVEIHHLIKYIIMRHIVCRILRHRVVHGAHSTCTSASVASNQEYLYEMSARLKFLGLSKNGIENVTTGAWGSNQLECIKAIRVCAVNVSEVESRYSANIW